MKRKLSHTPFTLVWVHSSLQDRTTNASMRMRMKKPAGRMAGFNLDAAREEGVLHTCRHTVWEEETADIWHVGRGCGFCHKEVCRCGNLTPALSRTSLMEERQASCSPPSELVTAAA